MKQLTGLDASFLNMETATTFGHVAHLVVCDATTPGGIASFEEIKRIVDSRLHHFPPYRQRLVEVPLALDHPYWLEDPDFDLEYHLREAALPAPGTDQQLAELVARIMSRPLDRRRPLWEMYLISGLEDGRIAWLNKMHHSAVDGMSGAELLVNLLDRTPEVEIGPSEGRPWRPEREPSASELLGRAWVNALISPLAMARLTTRMLRLVGLVGRTGRLPFGFGRVPLMGRTDNPDARPAPRPLLPAPRTPFNAAITAHRRYAFRSFSLEDAKRIKRAFGVTINDVILAVCAGGLREWLIERDALPARALVAMVPVSVTGKDEKPLANRISMLVAPLPVHLDEPMERLRVISNAMRDAKSAHGAIGADLLQDFSRFATPAIAARAARIAFRTRMVERGRPLFNLVVSNVPGPRFPLYLAGARMHHWFPVSLIQDGAGLNITVHSYMDSLDFGLVSCRELVPELWAIIDYLDSAMRELLNAAVKDPAELGARNRTETRSLRLIDPTYPPTPEL
jgi:diacylglycerol O-acyltransferase / wax synthase